MHEFTTRRRVEFADTDMGGIVHFSRYFVFMETAEHLFLNEVGTSASLDDSAGRIGWPRVAASCEYVHPARFGDEVEIRVRVARKGVKSMTYEFSFRAAGRELARGSMTSVCCRMHPDGRLEAIPIPAAIARRIGDAPAS